VSAINELADAAMYETVQFTLTPSRGTISYSGSKVVISVQGESGTIDTSVDNNGQAIAKVLLGKTYTVTYPTYTGYTTPVSETYTAELRARSISKTYAKELTYYASVVLEESANP